MSRPHFQQRLQTHNIVSTQIKHQLYVLSKSSSILKRDWRWSQFQSSQAQGHNQKFILRCFSPILPFPSLPSPSLLFHPPQSGPSNVAKGLGEMSLASPSGWRTSPGRKCIFWGILRPGNVSGACKCRPIFVKRNLKIRHDYKYFYTLFLGVFWRPTQPTNHDLGQATGELMTGCHHFTAGMWLTA